MPLFTDRPLRSTAGGKSTFEMDVPVTDIGISGYAVAAALTVAYVISSMTSSMRRSYVEDHLNPHSDRSFQRLST